MDSSPIYRRFLRPYQTRLAALAAAIALSTLTEGLGLGLFYPLVRYIQEGDGFLRRGAAGAAFARLAGWGVSPSAGLFLAAIFAVIVANLLLRFAIFIGSARVYEPLMRDLRREAFHRILHSHLSYFHGGSSAALSQTLENEVEDVGHAFNFAVVLASSVAQVTVYGALLLAVSWRLTTLVGALAAMRYAVSSLFIRRTRALGAEHGELRRGLKSFLIAIHQGIDVVKTFGTEDREEKAFAGLAEDIRSNADSLAATAASSALAEGLLGDGALCAVVYLAVARLGLSGAALFTFLFTILRSIPKVTAVNDARIRIHEYLSRLRHLPQVLAGTLPDLRWGGTPKVRFEDRLELEDVSFTYPGSGAPALRDVRLALRKNETLAVVGESGSGKTTLARLVLRLFDPTLGRITVDGVPLPELRREDWTRLVGVVSQDTFVFDDTVENNVKYGSPDCPEEAFRQAMDKARASDFVSSLPEKERTRLGERGVKLSGGQRQRIAIARAFLRNPPILILDEATSAMDSATERLIQEALAELSKDRTMLVIAHRFATIRDADRIIVLDRGRVAESGTHEELLRSGPLYRRYHELQSI